MLLPADILEARLCRFAQKVELANGPYTLSPLEDASMAPPAPMPHVVVFVSIVFMSHSRAPESAASTHIPIVHLDLLQFKNRCTSSGQGLLARNHRLQHTPAVVGSRDRCRREAMFEQAQRVDQTYVLEPGA